MGKPYKLHSQQQFALFRASGSCNSLYTAQATGSSRFSLQQSSAHIAERAVTANVTALTFQKLFSCFSLRNNRTDLSVSSLTGKSHDTVCCSKQSIIFTKAYIQTRMNMSSTLSVKDVAGFYKLSVCSLGTQSLGLGITAVLCRTYSLFMSEELKI